MKLDFEGRTWQLDTTDIDMVQALAITTYTGLSLAAWEKATIDPDGPGWLKSIKCLYWLMLEQNNEPVPLEGANFAPVKFLLAYARGAKAEAPAGTEVEEDPTKPAGEPGASPPATPSPASLSG